MGLEGLANVFIYLIIIGCVFGLIWYLLSIVPIPDPFKGWLRIAFTVVIVIFLIYWLLSLISGGPILRIR